LGWKEEHRASFRGEDRTIGKWGKKIEKDQKIHTGGAKEKKVIAHQREDKGGEGAHQHAGRAGQIGWKD